MKNIQILYEDDFLLILNKPAGLAVQGGEGIKSSIDKILAEIRTPPPLLVHRLDMDTSGILLTAKGHEAASRLSRLFAGSGKVTKQYTAVCSGCPEKKEGSILQELNIRGSVKNCETRYKLVKKGIFSEHEYSVLEIEPETGRMHQIRRHLAMIGNPIMGDDKYGDFSLNKKLRKAGVKRLLLHASRLIINEEFKLNIISPMPDYFHPFT
ncbi:MAG: RluA family pseudouridine synthase [Treponema sp.]|nr:RluA family pseudouridine synthase [Treponema sp.]MCL2271743.1 RluA family pseudouridine synthase [Treponema sp.]